MLHSPTAIAVGLFIVRRKPRHYGGIFVIQEGRTSKRVYGLGLQGLRFLALREAGRGTNSVNDLEM